MRFGIDNLRVKTKNVTQDHLNWLQRIAIRILKIEVDKKYNVDFYLTIFKEDYLQPGMCILLDDKPGNYYVVISKGPLKNQVVISSCRPIKGLEIKIAEMAKEGAYVFSCMPEGNNFKRIKYS